MHFIILVIHKVLLFNFGMYNLFYDAFVYANQANLANVSSYYVQANVHTSRSRMHMLLQIRQTYSEVSTVFLRLDPVVTILT